VSKNELIEMIRKYNRSVTREFLERFGEKDLMAYLERVLTVTGLPVGTAAPRAEIHATVDSTQNLAFA
jgi:hypothetical protein